MRVAAGTIVAKPVLPYARVLARSFREHHPEIPFHVLLADRAEGRVDPGAEPYLLVELEALPLPRDLDLRFVYEQQALSYALTPYLLEHLIDRYDAAVFVKQESLLTGTLDPVLAALGERAIALTPHLLAPPRAGAPLELSVLVAGVFNGGVIALRTGGEARAFLDWWQDRLRTGCRHAIADGMHYEQRWLDLVPTYFEDVASIRDPGVNVGHWNLDERPVERTADGGLTAGGAPCRLIRFSGFDPDEPGRLTRYNDRLRVDGIGAAAAVLREYTRSLLAEGWRETQTWTYAFARFDNGVPIPAAARTLYADRPAGVEAADPFTTGPDSFYERIAPTAGDVGPLWLAIHAGRPDLQAAFPDPAGADRDAFAAWASATGRLEHDVPDELVPVA